MSESRSRTSPAALVKNGVPSVSVCIPVYQGAAHIARAVRSVLDQSYPDFELVVRDNGSTDGTAEIVRGFDDPRIRLVRVEEVVPLAENWNRAVELCRAPLVKVLCADDALAPDCLRRQVEILADPDVVVAAGRVDMLDDGGGVMVGNVGVRGLTGRHEGRDAARRIVHHGGNPIGMPCAVLFRRSTFAEVGGFDGSRTFLMDLDLWARLLRHGALRGTSATVGMVRISPTTVSGRAGRPEFRRQREFTTGLAAQWQLPRTDLVRGTVGAYTALARRLALVAVSRYRGRRAGS